MDPNPQTTTDQIIGHLCALAFLSPWIAIVVVVARFA